MLFLWSGVLTTFQACSLCLALLDCALIQALQEFATAYCFIISDCFILLQLVSSI